MKITSAALLWLGWLQGAEAQAPLPKDPPAITPNFVPAPKRPDSGTLPAFFTEPNPPARASKALPTAAQGADKGPGRYATDAEEDAIVLRLDLPGPQGIFGHRESEANFYRRIGQASQRQLGRPAVFPMETAVSKDYLKPRDFAPRGAYVEPLFVMHPRLLFEQPNFERGLWDFGILQPVICLGVFYYDMAMLPYHYSQDWRDRSESNVGKCLPGDQAPLRVPIERFSVTGAIGEVGAIVSGAYLFP